jgi:colicin import membrane protein
MTPTHVPSLLEDRPTPLPLFVAGSVLGHVLVVAAWLVVTWVLAGPKVDLQPAPIKASLVRLGKPRDQKLLPRKEEEPAPPRPKVEEVAAAQPPPKPDTAVKIPTKDAKPEKADKKDGSKDAKKSLSDVFAKVGRQGKVAEELEGEADGDPDGDAARQEGERYFGLLNSVVKRNYDVSNTIDEAERRRLRAEVALRIGPGGELLEATLTRPSGNELFDSAVLGAVKKAAPFSAPPERLRDALKKAGVAFVFTP